MRGKLTINGNVQELCQITRVYFEWLTYVIGTSTLSGGFHNLYIASSAVAAAFPQQLTQLTSEKPFGNDSIENGPVEIVALPI